MYNNLLLTLCISIIPVLGIGFVILLVLYKLYIKVRSNFNIKVNCWFCNVDTVVPYLDANKWTCPSCQQYNGFNKDGDYNKEIFEQLDLSQTSKQFCATNVTDNYAPGITQSSNGFCDNCNEAQRVKIEKLAKFEPKNEKRFDEEFNNYKNRLESEFSLCTTCDRHLAKVLREKKKMVLGSKFLNLIIKGAETLKQPHLNRLQQIKREQWKKRCRFWILLLTLIQIACLCSSLPTISKDYIIRYLGSNIGNVSYTIISHVLALMRVINFYLNYLCEHRVVSKSLLFIRTIYMMIMYSMGLRIVHLNSSSLFISTYPFAVLILAFIHNIVDCFHLSRYTILMAVWSCFAAGLFDQFDNIPPQMLLFATTITTFICTFIHKTENISKLDNNASSFHKMYSEDYLSDDDTISLLSQKFNGSTVSNGSLYSNRSFGVNSPFRPSSSNLPMAFSEACSNKSPSYETPTRLRSFVADHNQHFKSSFMTPSTGIQRHLSSPQCNLSRRPRNVFSMNNVSNPMQLSATDCIQTEPHTDGYIKPDENFYNPTLNYATLSDRYQHSTSSYKPYTGLESRLSSASNQIYNNVRPNSRNIILPSRFNLPNNNCYNTSWLSGGYFNRPQQTLFPNDFQQKDLCMQEAQSTQLEDNLSRASSQSSGFESQQGPPNTSRENSYGPDANDVHHRTLKPDNLNTFKPIKSSIWNTLPTQQFISNHNSPLARLNSSNSVLGCNSNWVLPNISQKQISSSSDSFNLRKIDEQLPIINAEQFNTLQETQVES